MHVLGYLSAGRLTQIRDRLPPLARLVVQPADQARHLSPPRINRHRPPARFRGLVPLAQLTPAQGQVMARLPPFVMPAAAAR